MNERPAAATDSSVEAERSFDAFISYSRDDIEFGRALEKALRNFRPPKGIGSERRRLRVFRDETNLVGTHYPDAIAGFLERSQKLIVVCTPSARSSGYVIDEIAKFANSNGVQNIVPVLFRGRPNNEFKPGEFDDRAFPNVLEELLQEPLATDYRDYDATQMKPSQGQYRNAWYTLLANLFEVGREEIEQRDFRRQRRDRIFVASIVSIVIASLATFGTIARIQKLRADEQRNLALSGLAVNLAAKSAELSERQPDMSALVAAEALTVTDEAERDPVPEARQAMRGALASIVGERLTSAPERPSAIGFSDDGQFVYAADPREIRNWALPLDRSSVASTIAWSSTVADDEPSTTSVSKNGQWLVEVTTDRTTAIDIQNPELTKAVAADMRSAFTGAQISNDGRWALVRTKDSALFVLDLEGGDNWKALIEPPDETSRNRRGFGRLGFGPGTNIVHAANYDGELRFWSLGDEIVNLDVTLTTDSLSEIHIGLRSTSTASRLAISQETSLLALANEGAPLAVYAFDDDGAEQLALAGGDDMTARSVRFGPGEQTLIATLENGDISVWRAGDLEAEPITIEAELTSSTSIYEMSPDERLLAVANENTVRIWDLKRPDRRPTRFRGSFDSLRFTPDSRRIVSTRDSVITLSDVDVDDDEYETSKLALRYPSGLRNLSISADSGWLLSSQSNTLRLTDLSNPRAGSTSIQGSPSEPELDSKVSRTGSGYDALRVMSGTPSSGLPSAGAFSADGRWFAAIGELEDVLVADLSRPHATPHRLNGGGEDVTAVAFDPTSTWLIAGSINKTVLAWKTADLSAPPLELGRIEIDAESSVARLVFSADGQWLAASAGFGEISLWDWQKALDSHRGADDTEPVAARQAMSLPGHEGWVLSVDFSPDNTLLVTAGERAVQVWSPGSFDAPVARYVVPLGYSQARLIPGQRATVAGGTDGIVRIWDIDDPDSPAVELRGHESSIINIAVQAKGQLLATASEDGKVLLWQLDQPGTAPLRELDARGTNRIEFVSSGELVTSGYGPTALWNLADLSQPPVTLPSSGQALSYWTAVNKNEDAVGTISQDGVARIWPLGPGRLIDVACQITNNNLEYGVWRDAYGDMPYERTCKDLPVHMSIVDTGKALAAAGDVDKAVELLTHAVALDSNIIDVAPQQMVADIAVEAMLKRGKALARDGKVIAAGVQFERAKALNVDAVSDPSVYANQLASAKLHMQHGKKMAGDGRYEIAVADFITARSLDPDIDIDPVAEAMQLVVPHYLNTAQQAARKLDIDRAIENYRKVVELDPDRTLDPVIEASRHAAWTYRNSADKAAKRGDVELAIESYEKALAFNPTLDIDPRTETRQRAAPAMARRAVDELRDGRVDAGMALFRDAMRARPDMEITAECWNLLCWNGLLWNRPGAVADACGRAIATGPDDARLRDTRGVLRALSGELSQAIPDFEAYVEAYQDEREDRVAQRREWIAALKAGRNPLTEAELTRLREADNGDWFGSCAK